MDYKSAGVDIEKGDALVNWLKEDKKSTPHQDKVLGGIGGFASIFRMNFPEMKDPCLVSATDGIGTKLKLAIEFEKYDTLGQDLVAMCANDLICTGAQPLFFLDYFATSKLELEQAQPFLKGLRQACHDSQMALIGGETAEMPGLYQPKDFDCAGFAVGIVDREKILGPDRVSVGDAVIGVSSSGFHSNGFSLLRRLFEAPEVMKENGQTLLTPTALYVNLVVEALKSLDVSAVAHITGGGIHNLSRVLPEGLGVELNSWDMPEIFRKAQDLSAQKGDELSMSQMLETFNCGVGLVMVVPQTGVDSLKQMITTHGFKAFDLGVMEKSATKLQIPKDWQ
ncbi:MAG: phosphoribosylformylglycinamidine cyclo-ligase [Pseudomonadota bacterium]